MVVVHDVYQLVVIEQRVDEQPLVPAFIEFGGYLLQHWIEEVGVQILEQQVLRRLNVVHRIPDEVFEIGMSKERRVVDLPNFIRSYVLILRVIGLGRPRILSATPGQLNRSLDRIDSIGVNLRPSVERMRELLPRTIHISF